MEFTPHTTKEELARYERLKEKAPEMAELLTEMISSSGIARSGDDCLVEAYRLVGKARKLLKEIEG